MYPWYMNHDEHLSVYIYIHYITQYALVQHLHFRWLMLEWQPAMIFFATGWISSLSVLSGSPWTKWKRHSSFPCLGVKPYLKPPIDICDSQVMVIKPIWCDVKWLNLILDHQITWYHLCVPYWNHQIPPVPIKFPHLSTTRKVLTNVNQIVAIAAHPALRSRQRSRHRCACLLPIAEGDSSGASKLATLFRYTPYAPWIFDYIWDIYGLNVAKHSIHGAYRYLLIYI